MAVCNANEISFTQVDAGKDTKTQVLIGPETGPNFAMRRFVMQPGGGMPPHTNSVEHEQYILKGHATIGIGSQEFIVKPDDVIFIPAGVTHWYRAQDTESFEFLCIVPNKPDKITLVE